MMDRERLKDIPSVDSVLLEIAETGASDETPRPLLVRAVRLGIDSVRRRLIEGDDEVGASPQELRSSAISAALEELAAMRSRRLGSLLNATGVIVHTNLGRAPLSERAIDRIVSVSRGYSNLEYDTSLGRRGHRGDTVREYLCELTGAEDSLVVNNNASAVLLALNTLAMGREVVISRSELIEIGGSFRLPEVFERSGARMRAVGTTNRTRLDDYQRAIGNRTAAVMAAHWSNYNISGFVERVPVGELSTLSRSWGMPLVHDLGSGILTDPRSIGLPEEMSLRDSVESGASVVTASGDKLLGGPQAGIALGRSEEITRLRRNPLMRALRPGKLTLAALEATLESYVEGNELREIPVLRALVERPAELMERAEHLAGELRTAAAGACTVEALRTDARVGGGAAPDHAVESAGVALAASDVPAGELTRRLRDGSPPVIARTADDRVILDLRSVPPESDGALLKAALAALE